MRKGTYMLAASSRSQSAGAQRSSKKKPGSSHVMTENENRPSRPFAAMASDFEEIADVVNVMRRQEATVYRRGDFLASETSHDVLDASWRYQMCKWMHDMADVWHISRDVASFGSYYLDLIMARQGSCIVKTLKDLQLATMTCLHLAIKLHSFTLVSQKTVLKYGRGQFNQQDMSKMEERILVALKWQLHPPTTRCFQRQFMRLFPRDVHESTVVLVSEVSRFFIELSTNNYTFIKYSGASIAYAALIIAIEGTSDEDLPMGQRAQFYCRMRTIVGMNHNSKELYEVYTIMSHAFKEAGDVQNLVKGNALWSSSTVNVGASPSDTISLDSPRGVDDTWRF